MIDRLAKEMKVAQLRSPYIQLLALVAMAAAAVLIYPQFSLNHDASWYLVGTRMVLEGERLYVNVIEINPPLAFYLTMPVVWLADFSGMTDTAAFRVYVIALSGLSIVWMLHILQRSKLGIGSQNMLFVGGLVGLFVLPFADFGQREHLMLIFALPYFCLLVLSDELPDLSVGPRAAIGLAATLGLGLKPYFLLVPALIVLAGPIRSLFRRAIHPENLGLGAGLLAYCGFILVVHPEYLTQIVPVARLVYASYGAGSGDVLFRAELAGLLLLGVFYFCGSAPRSLTSRRLVIATLGFYLVYLIQFKGWNYHIIPCSFFLVLGSVWLFHEGQGMQRRDLATGVLAVVILFFSLGSQVERGSYISRTTKYFSPFVDRPGERILVLSANVTSSFPFVNEVEGRWSSRYPAQWLIPGALVGRSKANCAASPGDCKAYDEILSKIRMADIEDLLRYAPDLVYVDDHKHKSYFEGLRFDYLEFLGTDPRFPAIWSRYEYRGRVAGFQVWSKVADNSAVKQ